MDLRRFSPWRKRSPRQEPTQTGTEGPDAAGTPVPPPAQPVPDSPDGGEAGRTEAGPAEVPIEAPRDPQIDAKVALDILDVGDLLESYDIRIRLAEALAALPGIHIVAPRRGEPFDRSRHRWETTEPAADAGAVETVAYMISAGLTDPDGLVLRAARVAVYDMRED
jgi:hypothetical protein